MSETVLLDDIEIEDTDPRFETIGAIQNNAENKIDHDRVSIKYTDETQSEVDSIAIQPFVDKNTPHGGMGTQIDPGRIGELIDRLEMIQLEV
ncbi:hypothetical protein NP511_18010 [Natrinema thermotolerans]|uniref:Uncharacterized protein n=1 Tax=Natrinema thermotolerans TaxID=121872 RepID=A0AAF0PB26_9EURY|nr:hypothetical protein [Natrinema thermotolerans]QCC60252.1 hypothetical protein DVR14_17080 [Natrinema thermotolerans]QCC61164.1 hypothetical protein DVR14_21210 [Natrinema thermotolerans]WMT07271.1 hypothetical protein NP511_18010 [Natrinema thermotolerans]